MTTEDVVFYGLLCIAAWLVLLAAADARDVKAEKRARGFDDHVDDALNITEPLVSEDYPWTLDGEQVPR